MARRSDHTRAELKKLALDSAREIVRKDGISALSTRKLATKIGYTSGTIYQIFKNRDDLGDQLNTQTVTRLFEHCRDIPAQASVQLRLRKLAEGFVAFASQNTNEWDAVINYPFTRDYRPSEGYNLQIEQLMGLICEATIDLYDANQKVQQLRDARLLWASLYGIFSLASAGRLGEERTLNETVADLADLYLAARS
ncbi:MAG: TetR/AcrR family transcriptional regulator [Paracoccaceae bacterium]|nr:TetR/AcrR family transcriptional regulator [Paracoccaceae bacterium]MDG2257898.1 TetR/AcrR family transcriptional regulator [Paracoccaceae bacterium]